MDDSLDRPALGQRPKLRPFQKFTAQFLFPHTPFFRRVELAARAFELIANGTRIDAAEADRIGLVTRVFPAFTFAENVKQYLAELAKRNPEALTLTKRLLYDQDTMGFEDAIERGAQVNVVARNLANPFTDVNTRSRLWVLRESSWLLSCSVRSD